MNNNFLLKISNTTDDVQHLQLFSEQPPNGVIVRTLNESHDYAALHKISIDEGFVGNSITSDADQPIQLVIYNNGKRENVELNGRFERANISFDGNDNYIKVTCPAHLTFTLRLFTLPGHML